MIAVVQAHGSESRTAARSWHWNGYADNMHPSLIVAAIEAVKPFAKSQNNAKRWITKLRKRSKAG